jgi:hypothetical protein
MAGDRRGSEGRLEQAVGAYGLRIEGISEGARRLLGPADPSWETLELVAGIGSSDGAPGGVGRSHAVVPLLNGGEILVRRAPLVAEVNLPSRWPRDEELLHPYLGYAAVCVARWLGRECFHAGGFVAEGGVWAFVGERESGKSSMLGWLATHGHDIVCDDQLVVQDGSVLAGPRFLDLRRDAAEMLGAGTPLGQVGGRERWRLEVGPVPGTLPLRGWIFLDWGPEIEVDRAPAAQRLQRIRDQLSLRIPNDPVALLELASLPSWQLRRPWGWASIDEATRRLLDAIAL